MEQGLKDENGHSRMDLLLKHRDISVGLQDGKKSPVFTAFGTPPDTF